MNFAVERELTDPGGRFAIVASRFNEEIVHALVAGAQKAFAKHGVADDRIDPFWVPGAFEIPLVCRALARTRHRYGAILALGAVVRGETPHFEVIANAVSAGVADVSRESGVPVIFGVLTTDTLDQAWERAGQGGDNKGYDAALAALEMVHVMRAVSG